MRTKNLLFVDPQSSAYENFGPSFCEKRNGKAVIFGIPKCGNAWLQSMLVDYFESFPVLTSDEIDKKGVLSTHEPFCEEMMFRDDYVHGVCLIRDIRDIVVSYYYYAQTSQWKKAMTKFDYADFDSFYFEWFLSRAVPSHKIHSFAEEFAERSVPVLRYERLNSDTELELGRLIYRWGFSPDPVRVKNVVQRHQLKELKRSGLDLGYRVEPSHFRKGGWGNFLSELPLNILEDMNYRFEAFLRRWGYPVDLSDESVNKFVTSLNTRSSSRA